MSEHLPDRHDNGAFHGSTETIGDCVLIRLDGELDMATAPQLDRMLSAALDIGVSTVALDFTELAFLDSTAIHVLMAAQRRAATQRCSLVVRSPRPAVLKVLRLTGVEQLMVIEPGPSCR